MSDTDRSGALKRKVEEIVGDDNAPFSKAFAPYWELFEATTEGVKIRSFYMRVEGTFHSYSYDGVCEIAAICDGFLVNLSVNAMGARKKLEVRSLSDIGAINLYPGGAPTLVTHSTRNALLTVTTDHDDLYWFAKTEDEWGYLMDFAQDLVERIAAR